MANSFRGEDDSDATREAARRADVEAAYRREHAGYVARNMPDRAAAVVAAARAELGIDITPTGGEVDASPRRRAARGA